MATRDHSTIMSNSSHSAIGMLYKSQYGKCFYCDTQLVKPSNREKSGNECNTPTFDHIILKSNGGIISVENGVCACSPCNQIRGDSPYHWYVALCNELPSIITRIVYITLMRLAHIVPVCTEKHKTKLDDFIGPPFHLHQEYKNH